MAMREVLRRGPQLTLLVIFSLLTAALAGVGYRILAVHEDSLRVQAARELDSVATLDARFLSSWRGEREAYTSLLQHDESLLRALVHPPGGSGVVALLAAIRRHGYASAALLDAAGATLEESGAPVGLVFAADLLRPTARVWAGSSCAAAARRSARWGGSARA